MKGTYTINLALQKIHKVFFSLCVSTMKSGCVISNAWFQLFRVYPSRLKSIILQNLPIMLQTVIKSVPSLYLV